MLSKDNVKKKNVNVTAERTWQMKVEEMRKMMKDNLYRPTALLLSALDETACKSLKYILWNLFILQNVAAVAVASDQKKSEAIIYLNYSFHSVKMHLVGALSNL